jgi:hypothetical protein
MCHCNDLDSRIAHTENERLCAVLSGPLFVLESRSIEDDLIHDLREVYGMRIRTLSSF